MTEPNETDLQEATAPEGYVMFSHTFKDRFAGGKEVTVSAPMRRPTRQEFERAQSSLAKASAGAYRALCLDVVHADSKASLAEAMDTYPGLAATFGNELFTSSGLGSLGNG